MGGIWRSRVERDEVIAELTAAGVTVREMAERLHVTVRTVSRSRGRTKCGAAPAIPMTDDEHTRALAMLEDGCSYKETARTIGRSLITIRKHYPGYGWTVEDTSAFVAVRRAMAEL